MGYVIARHVFSRHGEKLKATPATLRCCFDARMQHKNVGCAVLFTKVLIWQIMRVRISRPVGGATKLRT